MMRAFCWFGFLVTVWGCPGSTEVPPSSDVKTDDALVADAAADIATMDETGLPDLDAADDTALEVEVKQCEPPDGQRPSRRSEHAGVYDRVGDQVVLFGGSFAIPVNCSPVAATAEVETWAYDVRCDRWRELTGTGPSGRARHMAAYDSLRRRMIILGGRKATGGGNYEVYDDLWALDLATEEWTELGWSSSRPSARVNGALVYDPDHDQLVLFGGNSSTTGFGYVALADLWTYDFAESDWTHHGDVAGGPSRRLFTAATWDSKRGQVIVFGGADETAFGPTAKYFGDLWALDPSTTPPSWSVLHAGSAGGPQGRFWAGMVFDTNIDRYILFGGHDDGGLGNRNDVWVFFPEQGQWVQVAVGDTLNKPANGVCDFPPDFTNVAMDVPERRNAHLMVASSTALFVMGGKTDCGVADDLVMMDFATSEWTDLTFATVGLGCIRKGGLNCTDLCL